MTQIPQEALKALRQGRKIEAIKILRQANGVGLAEAKALADAIERASGSGSEAAPTEAAMASAVTMVRRAAPAPRKPGLSPGQVDSSSGGMMGVAAVIFVVSCAIGAYYLMG